MKFKLIPEIVVNDKMPPDLVVMVSPGAARIRILETHIENGKSTMKYEIEDVDLKKVIFLTNVGAADSEGEKNERQEMVSE